jgi:predicted AlkP superfamily pyrophosphatase or phosphodiesterase
VNTTVRTRALKKGLLLIFFLLSIACFSSVCASVETNRHVVIISIDGLRPDFYLPGEKSTACPTLVALREAGCCARKANSVYPSLTYPAHASIITAVTPARHGITGNGVFAPLTEEDGRGFWYASDIKAPALWDAVHKAGLSVGAVSWPSSAGSEAIEWNLPEFWSSERGHELSMIRRYAKQEVLQMAEDAASPLTIDALTDETRSDEFLGASAKDIIRQKKPNLMLIHFVESDHIQHKKGPSSPDVAKVMSKIDALVKRVVTAVEESGLTSNTTFIIMGDHGFADVKKSIAPNVLLVRNRLITLENGKVKQWSAMVLNSGGSAGVYINPQSPTGTSHAVYSLLKKNAEDPDGKPLYAIVEKDALLKMGGPPRAAFYLEAEPGYAFSGSWRGDALVRRSPLKGNHGFLPTKPEMATGCVLCGSGIKQGIVMDQISIMDIAPTVATLLGVEFPDVDGRVLKECLADQE